jgi:hypothetical protein
MNKQKMINSLKKELMEKYPLMRCGNSTEFNQRLQWLSEGMLQSHITHNENGYQGVNPDEISLYNEFCVKRAKINNEVI